MKLTLNIDTTKLTEENLFLLAKITDINLFPLKESPIAKMDKDEQVFDLIRSRVKIEVEN